MSRFPPVRWLGDKAGPEDVLDHGEGLHPGLAVLPDLVDLVVVLAELVQAPDHLLLVELVDGAFEFALEVIDQHASLLLKVTDQAGKFVHDLAELFVEVGDLRLVLEIYLEFLVDVLHAFIVH